MNKNAEFTFIADLEKAFDKFRWDFISEKFEVFSFW